MMFNVYGADTPGPVMFADISAYLERRCRVRSVGFLGISRVTHGLCLDIGNGNSLISLGLG
jgi:hypothetical protein